MNFISQYFKPEVMTCPKCNAKLVYRYAVSNRLIYFSNGKHIRIHNLGYSCPSCMDDNIYVSQTANKVAFKGITYSNKILCMIAKYKEKKMSREEICDYFFSKNIEMSDRNVDNLYKKFLEYLKIDPSDKIPKAYDRMMKEFGQIRLSIDMMTVSGTTFIMIYDFFTCDLLAFRFFSGVEDPQLKEFLATYLKDNLNITIITSIRRDSTFIPMLKNLCPSKTKIISFNRF